MHEKIWIISISVRILVSIFQNGYIHPDEFFQTLEIITGDILEVNVLRTWEFSSNTTIRSIVPIYLLWSPPIFFYKLLNSYFAFDLINSGRDILTISRIYSTLLSLIVDYNIAKFCDTFNLDKYKALTMVSISYVAVVYYSRSFSNTFESLVFSTLIIYIAKSIYEKLYSNNFGIKVKLKKVQEYEPNLFYISFLLVLGIFNRPTFILFALVPMLYLIFYRKIFNFMDNIEIIMHDLIVLLIYLSIFSVIFILLDTAYFRGVGLIEFDGLSIVNLLNLYSSLVITPFNFLIYNFNYNNLEDHGIHPRYLHILVNMPLLFGPLIFPLINNIKAFNSLKNYQIFLLLCLTAPVLALSIFPHQEPRFLIPILTPVILCSILIGSRMFKFYILFNLSLCIFYGFLHQAGVMPALCDLRQIINSVDDKSVGTQNVIFFWNTYMPPRFPLMQYNSNDNRQINLVDLAGLSYDTLFESLVESRRKYDSKKNVNLLLIPGSLSNFVKCNLTLEGFDIQEIRKFYFHLSTENLPQFVRKVSCGNKDINLGFLQSCYSFIEQFSLDVYKIY